MTGAISLLVNPLAGSHSAAALARLVTGILRQGGYGVRQILGRTADEAVELTRASLGRDTVAVAAIGGDGSIQLATQAVAGTDVPLGIIPAGTGNDLADALGLPLGPAAAARAILDALDTGHRRVLDLGRSGDTWWMTVMCAGFDSATSERANRLTWPRGPRRYDVALVAQATRMRHYPMRITVDQMTIETDVTLVAVGNTRQYGGGKLICPAADPTDGMFDVTVIQPISRARLIRLAPLLRTGAHVDRPEVRTFRGSRVALALTDDTDLRAYADGEPLSRLPIETTCVRRALHVLAAQPDGGGAKPTTSIRLPT